VLTNFLAGLYLFLLLISLLWLNTLFHVLGILIVVLLLLLFKVLFYYLFFFLYEVTIVEAFKIIDFRINNLVAANFIDSTFNFMPFIRFQHHPMILI
jgi:hypothetical protein